MRKTSLQFKFSLPHHRQVKPPPRHPHRPAEVPSSKCPVWHRLEQLHGQATWAHLCRQPHPALAIVLHLKDQGARTHSSSTHHCKESPTTTKHFFQSSSRGPTHGCCVVVLTSGMSSHASPSTAPSESHPRRSQRRPWSRTLCCSKATVGDDAGTSDVYPFRSMLDRWNINSGVVEKGR